MKKLPPFLEKACDLIEIILSFFVTIAVIVTIISLIPGFFGMMADGMTTAELNKALADVFAVVVAVEFLKMLLKPTSLTVIEVLVFLIARHMIIGHNTAVEDLLSVVCICLLLAAKFLIKRYKDDPKKRLQGVLVSNLQQRGRGQQTESGSDAGNTTNATGSGRGTTFSDFGGTTHTGSFRRLKKRNTEKGGNASDRQVEIYTTGSAPAPVDYDYTHGNPYHDIVREKEKSENRKGGTE